MLMFQDGHNSGPAMDAAIGDGLVDGVIWSPADQRPDKLVEKIDTATKQKLIQAVDPQLYVARFEDANFKKLGEHSTFDVPMSARHLSAVRIPALVTAVLGFQRNQSGLTHIVSPSVAVNSMNARSAQTAFDLAEMSVEDHRASEDARPLLISVAVEAAVLQDEKSVNRLLNELTTLEADGFYLLLDVRRGGRPDIMRDTRANSYYLIQTLASNDYVVWVGYSGNDALAFRDAGAQVTGIGIHQKLQSWSPDNWAVSTGGRAPLPRIQLNTVLGSLLLGNELQVLKVSSEPLFDAVMETDGSIAASIRDGRSLLEPLSTDERYLQLFESHRAIDKIFGEGAAAEEYSKAAALLARIEEKVPVAAQGGKHAVMAWANVLADD